MHTPTAWLMLWVIGHDQQWGRRVQEGYDVLGGYMSPVHDSYAKKGLAPAWHRAAMCQLAAETSPIIMVGRMLFRL